VKKHLIALSFFAAAAGFGTLAGVASAKVLACGSTGCQQVAQVDDETPAWALCDINFNCLRL
jgi:hypothetical protein